MDSRSIQIRPLNFKLYLKNWYVFSLFESSENPHDSEKYFRHVPSHDLCPNL
jgi:hypothetical protein